MQTANQVRVRIAPSPSGYFHVGTARTAIYNYLFARHHGGKFVLRIEDTDADRSTAEFVDVILDGLKWLGIEWDEGPIHQGERHDIYRDHVDLLLKSGKAYRCFCTPDELAERRKQATEQSQSWTYDGRCQHKSPAECAELETGGHTWAVRLAVPGEGETSFDDLIAGTITRRNEDIEDFVIARADGRALYNLAVVVDDHLMKISHVIRGNDHITNTYKQVRLYEALGWTPPQFAHLPLILRSDRSKVSKRKGDPSVTDYRDRGYLPEALFNFLSLLGWSAGDDRELYTLEDLTQAFTLDRVSAANPTFDATKLEWMNGEYIRGLSAHELALRVRPLLLASDLITPLALETRWSWYLQVIAALRERCKVLTDFVDLGNYFFKPPKTFDPKGAAKHFTPDEAPERLRKLADIWERVSDFEPEALEQATKELAQTEDVKVARYIHPTRLALSGMTKGPGLYELAALVGQRECITRLRAAVAAIADGAVTLSAQATKEESQ